ncbi:unnamed protein product [Linum tenue]|nr:unnamed protein product [Linum tenue]
MQMGSATEVQTMNSPGLIIKNTDSIRWFLRSASNETHLPLELKDAASRLLSQDNVHYVSLRSIWTGSQPSSRPELMLLLSGSEFIFPTPKPREKGEELKARLRKLEELAERKAYQELVKDITPSKETTEPFSSYKDQLGFGIVYLKSSHFVLPLLMSWRKSKFRKNIDQCGLSRQHNLIGREIGCLC